VARIDGLLPEVGDAGSVRPRQTVGIPVASGRRRTCLDGRWGGRCIPLVIGSTESNMSEVRSPLSFSCQSFYHRCSFLVESI
jgi:hypothetical protein